ncbi:hypothetical protein KOW79_007361 [Hemibagrus wyckioides]|uniref:Uncharacterized protein n=1 Tax=Hemibagrus wyckioides TaxID=337641 RepID=A0A9D3NVJ0_9TELE|nr:hypothetical protein KOW79_007361 [Hemibagrus wyckioides]
MYYPVLTPYFYPQPSRMETDEEQFFLPSRQPSQYRQPNLDKRKCTLIRIQDPNDGGQDVTTDKLLGGGATSPPETMSPPETVSLPETVSPPKPESTPKTVLLSRVTMLCPLGLHQLLARSGGKVMDVLDTELQEAVKQKEQEVLKKKEKLEVT